MNKVDFTFCEAELKEAADSAHNVWFVVIMKRKLEMLYVIG